MTTTGLKWATLAVVVLGLLAGAYPIVQARNRAFYPAGQEVAATFMH
jgi:hypothetical protein